MTPVPVDIAERERAISSLDENVIVLAGAGTGKTRLLVERLVLLILGRKIPVERLVALTFTKKAGEEMRERLEGILRGILESNDNAPALLKSLFGHLESEWPALAKKALDDMPKAQIGTIHSFAAHLLRLYPLQAGVDPNFREDEGTIFDATFEKEWIRWLKEELGQNSVRSEFWKNLLRQVELSDLKTLARSLAVKSIDHNTVDAPVSSISLAKEVEKAWNKLKAEATFPSPQKAPAFFAAITLFEVNLQKALAGKPLESALGDKLRVFQSPPQSVKDVAPQLKSLRRKIAALSAVDENLIARAQDAVVPFVKRLQRELNRKGVVSFEDLLVFSRNLLRDHGVVREALKKRFAAFLVDEFQDTDPVQGEILFYLCEEDNGAARDWKKVKLASGRLFVVGDPKQSIYRFRGADIRAYEAEFQGHLPSTERTSAEDRVGFVFAVRGVDVGCGRGG
jgi:ATP-dependent helicase/nuclease subunit A